MSEALVNIDNADANSRPGTEDVPAGYKLTEVGVIPEDWEVRNLGTMGEFKNGINKDKKEFGHGFPFVNLMDVFGIPKISKNSSFGLVNSTFGEREVYALQSGDVLFVRSSVKPEGVGLTTVILEDLPNTVFSGFLIRYRDYGALDLKFKEHCFHGSCFRNHLTNSSTVSANANISQDSLKSLKFAFPPNKYEQRAIAGALSDVDKLLESLDALIAKKRAIKQATMQQLLTGKTRLPGFRGKWKLTSLGNLTELDPENLSALTHGNFSFRYITLEDVEHGVLRSYTEQDFANAPSRARRRLRPNDVLLSTVRPNLQSHLIFDACSGVWVCSTGFCVLRCRKGIAYPQFVFEQLFSDAVTSQIEKILAGSNYPAINSGDVGSLKIPTPSLDEQQAIATVLSDMDAEITALEQRRDKTRVIKQGMMQQLLTGRVRLV